MAALLCNSPPSSGDDGAGFCSVVYSKIESVTAEKGGQRKKRLINLTSPFNHNSYM